jgi:hypothetical protein
LGSPDDERQEAVGKIFDPDTTQAMQRALIQCANSFLLILILIGVPAITSARLGSLQLSSAPKTQILTLWGLALAVVANSFVALALVSGRRERLLCWRWAALFGMIFLIEYLYVHAYVNFDWLREALLWLQKRL